MDYTSIYPQTPFFDAPTRDGSTIPGTTPNGSSKTKVHRNRNSLNATSESSGLSAHLNKDSGAPSNSIGTSQFVSPKMTRRSRPQRFSEPVISLESLNLGEDAVNPKGLSGGGRKGLGLGVKSRRGTPVTGLGFTASLNTEPSPSNDANSDEPTEEILDPKIEAYSSWSSSSSDDIILPPSEQTTNNLLLNLCQNSWAHPDDLPTFIEVSKNRVEGLKKGVMLLDHQVRGREWMRRREDPEGGCWGGILADEMGLGKTVQMLVRIIDRRRELGGNGNLLMPTLIVCPLSILSQWSDEIVRLVSSRLRVKMYYGSERRCALYDLMTQDVVLTTYGVVTSEHQHFLNSFDDIHASKFITSNTILQKKDGRSIHEKLSDGLFRLKWLCVALDEAHEIRNAATKKAKACHELQATFRWCLTGTPFQNRASDFYSLCKFLRVRPYSNFAWFEENIAKPLKSGCGVKRALRMLHLVLSQIMLRRTKTEKSPSGQEILPLPKYKFTLVKCVLKDFERAVYDAITERFDNVLSVVLASVTGIRLWACVWVLLLRLRQACLHPSLIAPGYEAEAKEVQNILTRARGHGSDEDDAEAEDDDEVEDKVEYTKLNCQLCGLSLPLDKRNVKAHKTACEGPLRMAEVFSRDPPPSAKIVKILEILERIRRRPAGLGLGGQGEKTIVYSQFTSMLRKIKPFLDRAGFKYECFDGSMNAAQRAASLRNLRDDKDTTVILVSLMAGGVGLNLVQCNNIILVDLWWNPAVEEQAFARVHRMGQKRTVHIYKLVAENTVEERILALQEKKKDMANATLDRNEISNVKKLTRQEILMLLRG